MKEEEFAVNIIETWKGSADLQAEFKGNFRSYIFFREAEASGRARISPSVSVQ